MKTTIPRKKNPNPLESTKRTQHIKDVQSRRKTSRKHDPERNGKPTKRRKQCNASSGNKQPRNKPPRNRAPRDKRRRRGEKEAENKQETEEKRQKERRNNDEEKEEKKKHLRWGEL